MSDYLWDRSGEPDPEVERLERALATLRYEPGPPPFLMREPRRQPLGGGLVTLVAAASLVVALCGPWLFAPPRWEVQRLAGAPRVGLSVIAEKGQLGVGEWLTTDSASRAKLKIGRIGHAFIDPGSRIGLLDAGRRRHRLAMPRGVMHAEIWAPPGKFYVETPSAVAIDMGCAYTLVVEEDGSGLLTVESGWVGFEHSGRESFVPKGAQCITRAGVGPGTPHYPKASERFRQMLLEVDFGVDASLRLAALDVVLAEARREDALSLWHLLARAQRDERARVHDRLAALVPPPAGVTREGVLRGDRPMLDAWWDELDLGSASFWRLWKQPLPPQAR